MIIKINDEKEITLYVMHGEVDGGIEIDEDILPDNFFAGYKPKYFLYENGVVKENTNYIDPSTVPIPQNTLQDTVDMLVITVLNGGLSYV